MPPRASGFSVTLERPPTDADHLIIGRSDQFALQAEKHTVAHRTSFRRRIPLDLNMWRKNGYVCIYVLSYIMGSVSSSCLVLSGASETSMATCTCWILSAS